MRVVTVVCLLWTAAVVRGGTVAAFRPVYSDENDPDGGEEERGEDRKVSECFGKLRVACSLNPQLSAAIDRFARTLRVDKLRDIIDRKVQDICNREETEITLPLMREELSHSAAIVQESVHKLTDFDRDRLNMWSNLNDTLSERNFFLERMKSLSPIDTESLTVSLNTLISRLVNGEPPPCIKELIGSITDEEKLALANNNRRSFDQVVDSLIERIGASNDAKDLRKFLSGTWKSPREMFSSSE